MRARSPPGELCPTGSQPTPTKTTKWKRSWTSTSDLIEDASDFDIDLLRTDTANDRDLLVAFADQAEAVTRQRRSKARRVGRGVGGHRGAGRDRGRWSAETSGTSGRCCLLLLRRHGGLDCGSPRRCRGERPATRCLQGPHHSLSGSLRAPRKRCCGDSPPDDRCPRRR